MPVRTDRFAVWEQIEQIRSRLHDQNIGMESGQQVFELRHGVRDGNMPAPHAINVLQFPRAARSVRFDTHEPAMRLDVRVGPLLQPTQRRRPASDVSKRGFELRALPKPFVQSLSETAQGQRITQNYHAHAFLFWRRVWLRGRRLSFRRLRLRKNRRRK